MLAFSMIMESDSAAIVNRVGMKGAEAAAPGAGAEGGSFSEQSFNTMLASDAQKWPAAGTPLRAHTRGLAELHASGEILPRRLWLHLHGVGLCRPEGDGLPVRRNHRVRPAFCPSQVRLRKGADRAVFAQMIAACDGSSLRRLRQDGATGSG